MEFNWIQRHALKKLTTAESVDFKDLRPADIDANLFSYHTRKLVSAGLIASREGVYSLTSSGRHYVGSISIDTGQLRKQPKICVMLYSVNLSGELLLYRWQRQPYFNKVSLPYGKTQLGKSMEENVHHEAAMKLGVPVSVDGYLGDFYQKIMGQDGTLISHMLVHVFKVSLVNASASLTSQQSGQIFWSHPDKIVDTERIAGFQEILDFITTQQIKQITEITSQD